MLNTSFYTTIQLKIKIEALNINQAEQRAKKISDIYVSTFPPEPDFDTPKWWPKFVDESAVIGVEKNKEALER